MSRAKSLHHYPHLPFFLTLSPWKLLKSFLWYVLILKRDNNPNGIELCKRFSISHWTLKIAMLITSLAICNPFDQWLNNRSKKWQKCWHGWRNRIYGIMFRLADTKSISCYPTSRPASSNTILLDLIPQIFLLQPWNRACLTPFKAIKI